MLALVDAGDGGGGGDLSRAEDCRRCDGACNHSHDLSSAVRFVEKIQGRAFHRRPRGESNPLTVPLTGHLPRDYERFIAKGV
jgi:hypothetical protein